MMKSIGMSLSSLIQSASIQRTKEKSMELFINLLDSVPGLAWDKIFLKWKQRSC